LHRRGVELEAQVEAMKATISDLETEAKFFESTAAEASVRLLSHCHCNIWAMVD